MNRWLWLPLMILLSPAALAGDEPAEEKSEPKVEAPAPADSESRKDVAIKEEETEAEEEENKAEDVKEKSIYGPIQQRLFDQVHELELGWAYLPLDPYVKGYGVQLAYTYHFSHRLAWEMFRVGWSYNVDTKLKDKLITQASNVSPDEFPAVLFWGNSDLVLKLLYGKQTFLNRTVIHFEIFAVGGVSLVFRNPYNIFDMDFQNPRLEIGLNAGFGFRIWFNPTWSVRVDLRDTVILFCFNRADFPIKNSALLGLTLALGF